MSTVKLNSEECKGCGLCVAACPPKVLHLSESLNRYGYHPAAYAGKGCTGCGICYYACPEPGGIQVLRGVAAERSMSAAGGRSARSAVYA